MKWKLWFLFFIFIGSIQAGVNEDLLQGAQEGNFALVKRSIELRADLDFRNSDGETALILAAWYGSPEIVSYLLESGANINLQDNAGYTAIAKASSLGVGRHYEIVEILIQACANLNIKTKEGKSPFLLALLNGHFELAKVLRNAGAKEEPYFLGAEADKELLAASSVGDLQRVKYVFFFKPNVNTSNEAGQTPVMLASRVGKKEILILLLKSGALVDTKDYSGKTALMYAARRGNKEAVSVLLDYDADVDIEDKDHFTAATWAERFGQIEIAEYLKRLSDK